MSKQDKQKVLLKLGHGNREELTEVVGEGVGYEGGGSAGGGEACGGGDDAVLGGLELSGPSKAVTCILKTAHVSTGRQGSLPEGMRK